MKTFALTDMQVEKYDQWHKHHRCSMKRVGVQRYMTFSFTSVGIGDVVTVACSCGKQCDLTESDNW